MKLVQPPAFFAKVSPVQDVVPAIVGTILMPAGLIA
jgi:hypothetical protein